MRTDSSTATALAEAGVHQLLKEHVGPALRALALPMIASSFAIGLGAMADAIFVARLGVQPLAAFGYALPLVAALLQVVIGLGAGLTFAVGKQIGAGELSAARGVATQGLLLALLGASLLALIGAWQAPAWLGALGARGPELALASAYLRAWLPGTPFYVVTLCASAVARANGDARTSAQALVAASLVSLVASPLLIFGAGGLPGLGLEGAALASLLGYGCAAAVTIRRCRRLHAHLLAPRGLREAQLGASARLVLPVAAATAFNYLLVPLSMAVLTFFLAPHGSAAVAAFAVCQRLQSLVNVVPFGIAGALGPFVAQHWGSGQLERLREASKLAGRYALGWGLACGAVCLFASQPLASALSQDAQVQVQLSSFLCALAPSFAPFGRVVLAAAIYGNVGRPLQSGLLGLLRSGLLCLPLVWLGSALSSPALMVGAIALSALLTDAFATVRLRKDGLAPSSIFRTAPGASTATGGNLE